VKISLAIAGLIVFNLGTSLSFAQTLDSGIRPNFNLEAYVESIHDDNAFRTERNPREERQDRYGIDASGEFDSSLNDWRFAYRVERQEFEDDSQENLTNATGEARYSLGSERTWYAFEAMHVLDQVLQSPDSDVTTSTIGDQQLLELRPTIRSRQDLANGVYLTGIYRKVEFEVDSRPDATDRGAEIGIERRLSPRSEMGAVYSQSDIFSEDDDVEDMRSETVRLYYEGQSRKLAYHFFAGYQTLESLESEFDEGAAIYGLDFEYRYLDTSLTANVNKSLSNTAFAQSVGNSATGAVVVAEGDSDDIIDVLNASINWSTNSLCRRCQASLELQYQDVKYELQNALDFDIVSGSIFLDYRLSRISILSASVSYRETEFIEDTSRSAESTIFDIGYVLNFTENFRIAALYSWADQAATLANYESNRFGLRITKVFY